jgi:hypothetical protein
MEAALLIFRTRAVALGLVWGGPLALPLVFVLGLPDPLEKLLVCNLARLNFVSLRPRRG